MQFRIIPPHPGDIGKNMVRIPRAWMRRLGVSGMGAVLVTGTRTTASVCMPLEGASLPEDPEFEYMYEGGARLPVARLSDIASHNARGNSPVPTVAIRRASPAAAEQVTLLARGALPRGRNSLALQDLRGMPLVRGDVVRVRTAGGRASPPFAEFVVSEVAPPGRLHAITGQTRVEIAPFRSGPPFSPLPSSTRRRAGAGARVSDTGLEISLESLDIDDGGCRFSLDIWYALDDTREWLENRMHAAVSATDDLGGAYRCVRLRSGQSHWDGEGPQHTVLQGMLTPAPPKGASRLVLEVEEVSWEVHQRRDAQVLEEMREVIGSEPTVVSVWQPQKPFYLIAQGPWRLEARLHGDTPAV